eukprot:TRINITY_DN14039_c0_g1_i4.p1 TRINITY_DN14039_c0_g1~~TRINITY_DN14039_c0_g1_i4.p1  ORF type:complete len:464 (+),score=98.25 TRINITY_DN14039_c0_g1_i4:111-1394(+)
MDEMLRQAEERKAARLSRAAHKIQSCWRRKEERRRIEEKYLRMKQQGKRYPYISKYAEKWLSKTTRNTGIRYLSPWKQKQAVNSCCILQRAWRVHLAKRAVLREHEKKKKKGALLMSRERVFLAACRIQGLVKMLKANRQVRSIIENHQRIAIRKVVKWWMQVRRRLEIARKYRQLVEQKTAAAQVIQKNWRGFDGRMKASTKRLRQRIDQLRMVDWNAAIVVQRIVRGYFSRKRVDKRQEVRNLTRAEGYDRSYVAHEEDSNFASICDNERMRYQIEQEDAIRRTKLPAANAFMEECRQEKMRQISRHAREHILQNYSSYSGIKSINDEWDKQNKRHSAQRDYRRTMAAVAVIQKAFRYWLKQMTPEKRAFNTRYRALSKERNALNNFAAEKQSFLNGPVTQEHEVIDRNITAMKHFDNAAQTKKR